MSWMKHHRKSETFAEMAEAVLRRDETVDAKEEAAALYQEAADCEVLAYLEVETWLHRTQAIIATSALALYLKAEMPGGARKFYDGHVEEKLVHWPKWAQREIGLIMDTVS